MKKSVIAIIFLFADVLCQVKLEDQYKSVLDYPRIHFSGKYIVNAATVNNVLTNYNTDDFLDHHALPTEEGGKGGWNPEGSNDFLLRNVTVHTVCYIDGSCSVDKSKDDAIGRKVQDVGYQTPAKVVDLDPQAQQFTQIWGLEIKIPGLLQAKVDVLTLRRHWRNAIHVNPKNDYSHSGTMHGVLSDIIWDSNKEVISSEVIKQLKSEMKRIGSKHLSIRFVLDTFLISTMFGRIYGTIGVQGVKSSTTSILERLLVSENNTLYQDSPFKINKKLRKVVLDIGSCFPIDRYGKLLTSSEEYFVVGYPEKETNASTNLTCSDSYKILGKVPIERPNWLEDEAGFLSIQLSKSQVELLENRPLVVLKVKGQKPNLICIQIIMKECGDGIVVRPQGKFLFRKDSGKSFSVSLAAKKFGKPCGNLKVGLFLTQNSSIHYCCWPEFPLPDGLVTDKNGIVTANITLPVLRNPRKFIDGQVYGIAYYPKNTCLGKKISSVKVAGEFVIPVKVYNYHEYPEEVTWAEHVYPIFKQYANLYPIMKKPSVDLSSYHSVVGMKKIISLSMNLPMHHPNYMPVTRDMSKRKRRMITKWLAAEKPKLGDINKIISVPHLRNLLQSALEVEHATIPPYMTALWSIRNGFNRQVHRLIKTVIRQEMLHMGLVANLLNAIGGSPSLIHSSFIPKYPTPLPGGLQPNLIVSLEKLSPKVIRDVFMQIEKPDINHDDKVFRQAIFSHVKVFLLRDYCSNGSSDSQCQHFMQKHPEHIFNTKRGCPKIVENFFKGSSENGGGDKMNRVNFKSGIAAFYTHVLYVIAKLTNCGADNSIFTGDPNRQLTTDSYHYGNGKLFKVTDYVSAIKAVMTIIEEGEGTSDCDPAVHYVKEQDDLSHYTMFHTILQQRRINIKKKVKGVESYYNSTWEQCDMNEKPYEFSGKRIQYVAEATWPILKNAKETSYKPASTPQIQSRVFARLYNRLLGALHKSFNGEKEFFINAKFLMYAVDYYGRKIVQMPINTKSNPLSGPNAAPIFKWIKTEVKNLRGIKLATNHYASLNVAKKLSQKEALQNSGNKGKGVSKATKKKHVLKHTKRLKPKSKKKRYRSKCKESKRGNSIDISPDSNRIDIKTETKWVAKRHKQWESMNLYPDYKNRQRSYEYAQPEFEGPEDNENYDDYVRRLFDKNEDDDDDDDNDDEVETDPESKEPLDEEILESLMSDRNNDPRNEEPRNDEPRVDERREEDNDVNRRYFTENDYHSNQERTSQNRETYEDF